MKLNWQTERILGMHFDMGRITVIYSKQFTKPCPLKSLSDCGTELSDNLYPALDPFRPRIMIGMRFTPYM